MPDLSQSNPPCAQFLPNSSCPSVNSIMISLPFVPQREKENSLATPTPPHLYPLHSFRLLVMPHMYHHTPSVNTTKGSYVQSSAMQTVNHSSNVPMVAKSIDRVLGDGGQPRILFATRTEKAKTQKQQNIS